MHRGRLSPLGGIVIGLSLFMEEVKKKNNEESCYYEYYRDKNVVHESSISVL